MQGDFARGCRMSRNTKIILAILAVGAVFVGLMGYLANARRAGQSVAAQAIVLSAERELPSGKRKKENTIVTLAYAAGTAQAQGRARVDGPHLADYPAGRTVRICYDPSNTSSIRIEEGACG
ncbi:MAG: DUF3592 domain-containing protein [Sphingomonadales bacterium]|nr:MAG: DUF3592 domain-containing protein [Sphingomonadales bacterium]